MCNSLLSKDFDFSNLPLTVININVNSAPDRYVNAGGVTFTQRVLEAFGYPGHVQYCVDPSRSIFALRAGKALSDALTRMIPNHSIPSCHRQKNACIMEFLCISVTDVFALVTPFV
jgi:hypothetical protein